jgi:hypothetical protein
VQHLLRSAVWLVFPLDPLLLQIQAETLVADQSWDLSPLIDLPELSNSPAPIEPMAHYDQIVA